MLSIDHVILAVRDLEAASDRLLAQYGLASVPGGRHVGHGTANRIVPLGESYIELMGVVDAAEAERSSMGSWILSNVADGDRLVGWCLATDDLDAVADRLGFAPVAMQRERPDGAVLNWRLVGLDAAMAEPPLPFFIRWNVADEEHPGRAEVVHRRPMSGISRVEVSCDSHRLAEWLGDHNLPLHLVSGRPGLQAVEITADPPIRITYLS